MSSIKVSVAVGRAKLLFLWISQEEKLETSSLISLTGSPLGPLFPREPCSPFSPTFPCKGCQRCKHVLWQFCLTNTLISKSILFYSLSRRVFRLLQMGPETHTCTGFENVQVMDLFFCCPEELSHTSSPRSPLSPLGPRGPGSPCQNTDG